MPGGSEEICRAGERVFSVALTYVHLYPVFLEKSLIEIDHCNEGVREAVESWFDENDDLVDGVLWRISASNTQRVEDGAVLFNSRPTFLSFEDMTQPGKSGWLVVV